MSRPRRAPAGARPAEGPAIAWSLGLPFLVGHVVEDFVHGIAARLGVPPVALALLVVTLLAVQAAALVRLASGATAWRRSASLTIVLTGALWAGVGLREHGADLVRAGWSYRAGPVSSLLAAGLIASQAAAAALALVALCRRRQA